MLLFVRSLAVGLMLLAPQFEVFRPVVVSDAVLVVNCLVFLQIPAELLFHD